jgi:hypothetical protein
VGGGAVLRILACLSIRLDVGQVLFVVQW